MTDRLTAALALGTAALALAITALSPAAAGPLPWGFLTPVLVLELATGPEGLAAVLGAPSDPGTAARVLGWHRAHLLDLAFMALYSGLVAVTAWRLGGRTRLVAPLAGVVWAADLVETLTLLDLCATWGILEPPPSRWVALAVATWTKWIGLGAALALLGRQIGGRGGRLMGLGLPFAVGAALYPPWLAEGMGLAVLTGFAVVIVRALRPGG